MPQLTLPPALRAPLDENSAAAMAGMPVAGYEQVEALRAQPPARIKALEGGRMAVYDGQRRTRLTIPILGYVVEVGDETLVIDCGLSNRWRTSTDMQVAPFDSTAPGARYLPELTVPGIAEQVAALGIRPGRLLCTHMHMDHSGGALGLGLPLEASPLEWRRARGVDAGSLGYPEVDLDDVTEIDIELDPGRPVGPFAASHEVAPGVLALDTTGHSPGSMSFLIPIRNGLALVCGDAVYPKLDEPASDASTGMLRIRRFIADVPDVTILPGHDTSVLRACSGDAWL